MYEIDPDLSSHCMTSDDCPQYVQFGSDHTDGYCHNCGHFHDTQTECPGMPCGNYLCCVN